MNCSKHKTALVQIYINGHLYLKCLQCEKEKRYNLLWLKHGVVADAQFSYEKKYYKIKPVFT